jgi:hypothetical protein
MTMTPKLDKHQRLELLLARQRRWTGGWIRYGWKFNEQGRILDVAVFGWWRCLDDGSQTFLGRTFEEAEKALQSPD